MWEEDRTGIAPSTAILTGRVESGSEIQCIWDGEVESGSEIQCTWDGEEVTATIIALSSKFVYRFVGELQFWAYYKGNDVAHRKTYVTCYYAQRQICYMNISGKRHLKFYIEISVFPALRHIQ